LPWVRRGLRLWPGVLIVALMWLLIVAPAWVAADKPMLLFIAKLWVPVLGTAAVVCWWLLASRLSWVDRLAVPAVFGAAAAAVFFLADRTIDLFPLMIYALPTATTAWVAWLLLTPFLGWQARRVGLVAVLLLAWGYFALVRMEGIDGSFEAAFAWRWSPTDEDRFLAEAATRSDAKALDSKALKLGPGDWPGFRGPGRDGRLAGVRVATDWKQHPPRQLWRRLVGPGWGSFAVIGDRVYTQEQHGQDEAVVCHDAVSGDRLWVHTDKARFTEAVAGPGPRATPTFEDGKLYALGAAGRLNCLDPATGKVHWSRDIVADSGAKVPQWGFASSPLVAKGVVTVFAGGPDGKAVLGYKVASGDLAWAAGEGLLSYCSPQLAKLGGIEQVLIATETGVTALDPARGTVLWQHAWPAGDNLARIVQPALLSDTDLLIGTGFTYGTRRVSVQHGSGGWLDQEVWTTKAIRPYYNDLVIHEGHLYGFDGQFLTCVSLQDGESKWRARGYANGQALLLADQGLLVVLTEKGEVALVEANPASCKELGRFQAIKGKTWNHPVVAHGKLFVRNGAEAACFALTVEGDSTKPGK
jgi:outer membrane protein assembly factor BamB